MNNRLAWRLGGGRLRRFRFALLRHVSCDEMGGCVVVIDSSGAPWRRRSRNQTLEFKGIVNGVSRLIVVEVNVDGAKAIAPLADPLRPAAQLRRGVAALVFAA